MAAQTAHKKHSFYQDSTIPYLMNFKIMKTNSMLNIYGMILLHFLKIMRDQAISH